MCKNTLKKIRLFDYLIIILFHIEIDFNLYILSPFKSKLLLRYITYSVTIATEQWKYLKLVYPNERRIQNVRAPAQKPSASSSHSPRRFICICRLLGQTLRICYAHSNGIRKVLLKNNTKVSCSQQKSQRLRDGVEIPVLRPGLQWNALRYMAVHTYVCYICVLDFWLAHKVFSHGSSRNS